MPDENELLHLPERPAWSCADCRRAWPCPAKRTALLAEHADAPTVLVLYLSTHLGDAIDDYSRHRPQSVPDLFTRFLGWALQPAPGSGSPDAPLRRAAWQVADSLADAGYAFLDSKIEALAMALRTFLAGAGIRVTPG